jgi:TetR/AcrR family transcriptional repressor of nem operon
MVKINKLSRRPLEFNPQDVLQKIMILFLKKGYLELTFEEIEKETGIKKPSLYNYFGSKKDLFFHSLQFYHDQMIDNAKSVLTKGRGIEDILEFLQFLENYLKTDVGSYGCLMVNTMVDIGIHDPEVNQLSYQYRENIKKLLLEALLIASQKNQIKESEVNNHLDIIIVSLIGINVLARSATKNENISIMINSLKKQIESWKTHV